jgi:hypothetical protein
MPQPRLPAEVLRVKGSTLRNPKLFKDRRDPKADPLGPPSPWLDADAVAAWNCFVAEVPWLLESDRVHLELASIQRGRLMAGKEVGVAAMNLLRLLGGQMGTNPADRSRIRVAGDDDGDDPAMKYFHG